MVQIKSPAVNSDAEPIAMTAKSVSTNAAKSQSQTSRVPNVWPCHWLSKRRSKRKNVTSQYWAPLYAHYELASFAADRPSTNARQRIWNQWIAKRLEAHPNRFVWSGAPPNGPVWSGPAVEDPKLEQSRVMDTRSIRRLEYVRMVYFWTVTP